jgi:geranylgeranyl pyrophosphate synthase
MPSEHAFPAIGDILAPVQEELRRVETRLLEPADSQPEAITYAVGQLLGSGGKRLRPAVALLSAGAFGAPWDRSITLAAALEMLHTATLVHDDFIDGALLRRGKSTLNAQWSPAATVLTGDYLFARAAEHAAAVGSLKVMTEFAVTLRIIVRGEINQLFSTRSLTTREVYFERIHGKTAALFSVAAGGPVLLMDAGPEAVRAMEAYGREIGMAFQIVDDVLDFTGSESTLGKPVGSDLRHGLLTLPLLYYLGDHPQDPDLQTLLKGNPTDPAVIDRVVEAVCFSGAIDAAMAEAHGYVARAQAALVQAPDNLYRQALFDLATYVVRRGA